MHERDVQRTPYPLANARVFFRRLFALVRQPVFLLITLFGNLVIASASALFYLFEHGVNPTVRSPLESIYWAFATVTTVGYGDIAPVTPQGRVLAIVTMVVGTCLFWGFTALFAGALLTPELRGVEKHLARVEHELDEIEHELDRKQP